MADPVAISRAYRAIWRWHFYAGLIVAPFLLILAVTGAIYLFNDELNVALSPHLYRVAPHAESQPPSRLAQAALGVQPGTVTRIDLPAAEDRSAIVFVTPRAGDPVRVAVDRGRGRVLGTFVYARTLVGFADGAHGTLMAGAVGEVIVELAACWALVLIATGLYLWWPRGRRGLAGIVYPRLSARGRPFWRDLHATTGVWTVVLIAFLLLTGLPWAKVQGDVLQRGTAALGIGYPAAHRTDSVPQSATMKAALGETAWTMEQAPMPASSQAAPNHIGHDMAGGSTDRAAIAGLDAIAATLARDHDLAGGYRLFPPTDPTGVYTAYTYPDRPQGQRTLYFDRYSMRLIRQVGYADYGAAAKAIELGVQLHMGNYFGLANQLVMLVTCVAIVLLVVSGVVMWWRRRPTGRVAAPPRVPQARIAGAAAILIGASLLFPLLGLSVVVVFLIDRVAAGLVRVRGIAG
ncbi:PepSY-associated TM helix domain-containing protein [Sphingomonas radiodurans]|uniref:PepSY-associated TM helix domain-containing protein n=1 Tax=Sphingomonas radiodurans TaxID=2890321 RepID=UPI001E2F70EE|nr:PepSY domain-containing protein [Sphingomonas radiodurans]WBH17376.1 PepSY domain-containing protein [Sphingomonas radiodurans]